MSPTVSLRTRARWVVGLSLALAAAAVVGLVAFGGPERARALVARYYWTAHARLLPAPTPCPIPAAEPAHEELVAAAAESTAAGDAVAVAEANGALAREAFTRADRVAAAWLAGVDPRLGLLPRKQLPGTSQYRWNTRDVAADLYSHLVNEALLLAPQRLAPLEKMLATERSRSQGLPVAIDLNTGETISENLATRTFGAVEYAKDGLLSVVESSDDQRFERRLDELLGAIEASAAVSSRFGALPTGLAEKNGELLQVLARLAHKLDLRELGRSIADAYTKEVLPANNLIPAEEWDFSTHEAVTAGCRLVDHGNEAIAGLVEWTLAEKRAGDPAAVERAQVVEAMLDRLLEIGRRPDGLWRVWVEPSGVVDQGRESEYGLNDNWGYLTSAYVAWALALPEESPRRQRYIAEARRTMAAASAIHRGRWERGAFDGYADSVEGALYLLPFLPDPAAESWVDEEVGVLFAFQRPDGLVEGQYLDGNFVRTALLYGFFCTAGVRPVPWAPDLSIGAAESENGALTVAASVPAGAWRGVLRFDEPRHRTHLGLPADYPRLNSWPEWFVVGAGDRCELTDLDTGASRVVLGAQLTAGLPAVVTPDDPLRLRVRVLDRAATR